ncbi:MAG: hypothetical protein A3B99_04615 [Candidatus Yanofskybacteria bacterium RIFCSPHIGHO2_02_FULL_44_12b]|uniref:Uncharacterized protein n=2 Tax=Candidatus Yanofskyibacteriota TaxID=1752733 RepID=A0A1F8GMS7_9BACT|nr:MAG: hypothetical protein UW79_C0013G0060 [Candidatus Yanofskybacteria bacterium GW2011_GWA2_44_9]OGN04349.1 MAG: hypothetical protein A2659_03415 [Candidatus Yanofskybacteria bacterium RIFCSPHIGHO2_01_FULL_44_24]OGN14458.1 MAG: hypothetical protein A3B99_04615 [Candidatus Yanofskybacteria bacterium RIFCSPHIGHO2_02_FULL_44_12b]OGN25739.1 MAG: hypothetical protein A2925_00955 [Candidatus Yanofskybacteria bacterium RIFCSPLOWO2_01_FULL_44_22]
MNIFLKLFALLYTYYVHRLEKKIGYRVIFTKIPGTWINGLMTLNMERSWARQGIKAWGVNYWTIGSLTEEGISSRYDRNQKQYQSWLGAYLVKFKEGRKFTLQDHFNLAVADQKNWLEDFHDPHPFIEMPAENVAKSEPIKIGEYSGTLYEFGWGPSHSDVGKNVSNLQNKILMALTGSMFDEYNKRLHLKGSNFIPKDIRTDYETVILKGYIAVVELEKNVKVVLYGNGAELLDRYSNEAKDYTPLLKEDILMAFKAVVINKT